MESLPWDVEFKLEEKSSTAEYNYATHTLFTAGVAVEKVLDFSYSEKDYKGTIEPPGRRPKDVVPRR